MNLGCLRCIKCRKCRMSWENETAEQYAQMEEKGSQLKDVSSLPAPKSFPEMPPQRCRFCLEDFETTGKCRNHMKVCAKMPYKMWLTRTRVVQGQKLKDEDKSKLPKCEWCGTSFGDLRGCKKHSYGCKLRMNANKLSVTPGVWHSTCFEDAELPETYRHFFQTPSSGSGQ